MKENKTHLLLITILLIVIAILLFIFRDLIFKNNEIQNGVFESNVKEIVKIFNDFEIDTKTYNSVTNTYYINEGAIVGFNYNSITQTYENNLNYKLSSKFSNIKDGIFIKRNTGELYYSINDGNMCAVKAFHEENMNTYSLKEKEKCRIAYVFAQQLNLNLYVEDIDKNPISSGEVVNNGVILTAKTNLLDTKAATYKWYRNGKLYEESDSYTLVLKDEEDAMYYVEVTPFDAEMEKTEEIHVVIKK